MGFQLPFATRPAAAVALGLETVKPVFSGFRATGVKRALPPEAGDRARAREIYEGFYAFPGGSLQCRGRSVFALNPPSAEFASHLHGFGWLKDLQASGRSLDRIHARALVADWLDRKRMHHPASRLAHVRIARLMAWTRSADFLLEGAEAGFAQAFFRGITSETHRMLLPQWKVSDRLPASLALSAAVTTFAGLETLQEIAEAKLARELAIRFPEGIPLSRNPAELAAALEELGPLREQSGALDSLASALAFLTLGDGRLALFHGCNRPESGATPAQVTGMRAGYARLCCGDATLVADGGSAAGTFSLLAFEFSAGSERIITNCGWPERMSPRLRQAANQPAAHSGPCLENLVPQAATAQAICGERGDGAFFRASHNAYPGWTLGRSLFLATDGRDLRGEDELSQIESASAPQRLVLRFHMTPAAQASLSDDGRSVLIATGLQIWSFTARGGAVSVEESVSMAGETHPVPARQIVLTAAEMGPARINWAFRRVA